MERNKLYRFVLLLSLTGILWLGISIYNTGINLPGCLFHKITGVACPACGSTRAVIHFLTGHYKEAFYINPLGVFTGIFVIVSSLWIIKDLILNDDSFYQIYQKTEIFIRTRRVAFPLIFLLVVNWLWNITKQL